MTRIGLLPWPVAKEVRALGVPWLACAVAVIVPTLVGAPRYLIPMQVTAYYLGLPLLGALSIGREYTDHTLSLLLSMPVSRRRLLLIKWSVLAVMMLVLGAAGYASVFRDVFQSTPAERLAFALLPLLYGLFVTPALTMASRSPAAGVLFTMTIPCVLEVLGAGIGTVAGPNAVMFSRLSLWTATVGVFVIGAVATWLMFMRLEAIEGRGEELHLPQWLRPRRTALRSGSGRRERSLYDARASTTSRTTRRPIWLLIAKELRIQHLTLELAGLYLLGWLGAILLRSLGGGAEYLFSGLSAFYTLLLGLLIGSIASAEERQCGTLEWQLLLPVATSKQWVVKTAVALGLVMLLGIGLPMALASVSATAGASPSLWRQASGFLLLTVGSLYVSSFCASSAVALVMSVSATVGAMLFHFGALLPLGHAIHTTWWRVLHMSVPSRVSSNALHSWPAVEMLDWLLIAVLCAVVLRFGLTNHRYTDRSPWRVGTQILLIAAAATIRVAIVSTAEIFGQRW